jgi:hypothetical protein
VWSKLYSYRLLISARGTCRSPLSWVSFSKTLIKHKGHFVSSTATYSWAGSNLEQFLVTTSSSQVLL